jgi:hypothetical protein
MPTVFLSSTSKDLKPCRDAAYKAIEGLHGYGYHCIRMEDFGASAKTPDDLCRARVAESDLVVCIVGPLYGSRSPAGLSFTEREFDAAIAETKPCLVFLTSEDFPLPANLIETDEDRKCQARFREKATNGRMVARFSTPEQISTEVVTAISNWEASRAGQQTQAILVASQVNSVSYRVAILNRSSTLSDKDLGEAVDALQKQVHRDFAPAWGIDAQLTVVARGSQPPPGSWLLEIDDESPWAGSYHMLSAEGLPLVKISLVNTRRENRPWTMAASHELLETLADPGLNLTVFFARGENHAGRLFRRQVCDPVSSPKLAYKIDGTVVSDFVYPAWFESFRRPGSAQFDHRGHLDAPFQRAPHGYMSVFDVHSGSDWYQEGKKAHVKASKEAGQGE